jgi:hypothetical protein
MERIMHHGLYRTDTLWHWRLELAKRIDCVSDFMLAQAMAGAKVHTREAANLASLVVPHDDQGPEDKAC